MTAHRVAVLALDGVVALDLGVPAQILGAARGLDGKRRYDVATCSPGGRPVTTTAGFRAMPEYGLELLNEADTVIVPGVHGAGLPDQSPADAGVLDALRHVAGRARVMSICTGAFVLAEAGLLDGRDATTHWAYADRFRRRYPLVRLDPEVLFIDEGDLLTSAGVAAGIDLCLHLVRRDHGAEVANRAARRCVVAPWRDGGQSQFIERPLPTFAGATTARTRSWALQRLDEPLDLRLLAQHARTSVRTFTRRFREETGLSPNQWLIGQRIEQARRLLESTDLAVDQVARRCGFATAVSLRQHLHAVVGVSPGAYRRMYRRPED
jgi:transcriptional regulator GlxA family with amidase domain